jgi:hypothetical protein
MCLAAAATFFLAFVLDAAGRLLHREALWRLGGHLWMVALLVGSVAWLTLILERREGGRRHGVVLVLGAVAVAALARWVRGSAGVPPDPPVEAAEAISAVLILAGWFRARG